MAYGRSVRAVSVAPPVLSSDPVRLIMTSPVAAVDVSVSLREAVEQLAADEIGALLVTGDGALGVLSERDVIAVISGGGDLTVLQAGDALNSDLLWVRPEDSIRQAAMLMLEGGVRHLPVGDGRTAIGMVSIRDVLGALVGATTGS